MDEYRDCKGHLVCMADAATGQVEIQYRDRTVQMTVPVGESIIVKHQDADTYEITPKIPYTQADLDWNNENSRCVKEWKDESSRPEIDKPLPNIDQYDVVFIGYPIWWEASPNIIYTFLESWDFSGKTLVPFSTSGRSIRGSSGDHLHKYCSGNVSWKEGKLLNRTWSAASWIKKLGI